MSASKCFLVLAAFFVNCACFMEEDVADLLANAKQLAQQVMMQQQFIAERLRATGSGFRQVRLNWGGSQPHMVESMSSSNSYLAVHSHFNHIRTLGMGEVQVIMNGVEFRTHHNDFMVVQPHPESNEFQATREIPFPEVPPEVLEKTTVEEQITEMREWFKAFKMQDHGVRDYRKYFKPMLCYLEGYWIYPSDSLEKDDPFRSDRHENAAKDWQELHDKIRFLSYAGMKKRSENLAYLPQKVVEIVNETVPVLAQWTYRPICHPLKHDLPTNRFHLVDDLTARMKNGFTKEVYAKTRYAHYSLNPRNNGLYLDEEPSFGLLDELMSEVPGLDGYGAVLRNDVFGTHRTYKVNETEDSEINAAYYHRWYKSKEKNVLGSNIRHTGFNDPNIFMALTTQPRVAGVAVNSQCSRNEDGERQCSNTDYQRWTYALPLEIVYMTPIQNWNPYSIIYRGDGKSEEGEVVTADDRDGSRTLKKAFDGVNSMNFYITPSNFYSDDQELLDPADTGNKLRVGVLNSTGHLVEVASSGFRITYPKIPGVGKVRQRYPIAQPVLNGNAIWKELHALKQLVMNSDSYQNMFSGTTTLRKTSKALRLGKGVINMEEHTHKVRLTENEMQLLENGHEVTVYTSYEANHSHTLKIRYIKEKGYKYVFCDRLSEGKLCYDKHPSTLHEIKS